MNQIYEAYLNHLASFAAGHTLAVQAENNVYPLFSDIKRLIGHYHNTISKFVTVQDELVRFIEQLSFDSDDFDYYQGKFIALRQLDGYIEELKNKPKPEKINLEIQIFILDAYQTTSLFNIDKKEEQVLKKINYTFEVQRANKPSGCVLVFLLFIISIAILNFTIFNQ
jgi:hypothetical protein